MVDRDDVLRLIQQKGPIVPTDITADLKENSFIVGAILSELVASKKLILSNAKLGGSPLYLLPTQKSGLTKLYPHLNEKDRRAYDVLKRDIILYDEPQTPLMRTALRGLKDFAVPFKVTYKGKQLLYWRWYLASEDEVKSKVHASLSELFPQEKKVEPKVDTKPVQAQPIKEPPEDISKLEVKESKSEPEKEKFFEKPKVEPKIEPKKETPKEVPESKTIPAPMESQKTLFQPKTEEHVDDEFAIQVSGFVNSMNIKVLSLNVIKKKKEIDFILEVPSPVGSVKYFAKARNKKRSNEGDISTAFVEGQLQGLPVMYISPGDLPKKLEGIIAEKYKNLKVLKL